MATTYILILKIPPRLDASVVILSLNTAHTKHVHSECSHFSTGDLLKGEKFLSSEKFN